MKQLFLDLFRSLVILSIVMIGIVLWTESSGFLRILGGIIVGVYCGRGATAFDDKKPKDE